MHLVRVVDRPHVDLQARCVGGGHEALGHERDRPLADRDLDAGGRRTGRRAGRGRRRPAGRPGRGPIEVHSPGPSAARSRARRRSEKAPTHTRSTRRCAGPGRPAGSTAASCLGSMLTRTSGQAAEQVLEQGDRPSPSAPGPRAPAAHGRSPIAPSPSVNRSRRSSWKATQHPVRGDVDVGLQVAVAQARRRPRRPPSCSRRAVRGVPAPVGEGERSGEVEEREAGHVGAGR